MSDLVAIAYPDLDTAKAVMAQLEKLQAEKALELGDAVIVEHRADGRIKLHQTLNPASAGAIGGALWGGLIGLLFLAPALGMAVGAATGGAAGALTDVGVDDGFMRDLGHKLAPGTAAVIVLVRDVSADNVLERIEHRGEVLQTSLSDDAEQHLRDALEGPEHRH
jgi:uncharacterized membrane protein